MRSMSQEQAVTEFQWSVITDSVITLNMLRSPRILDLETNQYPIIQIKFAKLMKFHWPRNSPHERALVPIPVREFGFVLPEFMLYFSKCGFGIGSTLFDSFKRNKIMKRNENEQFMILHDRKIYIEVWTFKLRKNAATTKWTFENMHFWALQKFLFSRSKISS